MTLDIPTCKRIGLVLRALADHKSLAPMCGLSVHTCRISGPDLESRTCILARFPSEFIAKRKTLGGFPRADSETGYECQSSIWEVITGN